MSKWWKAGNVSVSPDSRCYHCPAECTDEYIIPTGGSISRGRQIIHAARACRPCFEHEYARIEAQDKGWRFSEVDLIDLCRCGRPYVLALQECFLCAKERRLLGYQAAEIKRCLRILQLIRQEIRDSGKQETIHGNAQGNLDGDP